MVKGPLADCVLLLVVVLIVASCREVTEKLDDGQEVAFLYQIYRTFQISYNILLTWMVAAKI
jgi:hypothetical protein